MSAVDGADESSAGTRVKWMLALLMPPFGGANYIDIDADGKVIVRRQLKPRYVFSLFEKLVDQISSGLARVSLRNA